MDPFTIASIASIVVKTAKSAWDIGEALYTFTQEASVVDETIRALQSEIKSFGDACSLLQLVLSELEEADKVRIAAPGNHFWDNLESATQEYGRTVDQLRAVVKDMNGKKENFARQGWKQVKLNMRREEITAVRARIRSHLSSVQMIVGTLNLVISMATSRQLDPRALAREIVALQEKRAEVDVKASIGGKEQARDAKLAESTAVFIDTADQTITSATSIYEDSVAGGSNIGGPTHHVADWLSALDSIEESKASLGSSADSTRQASNFSQSEQRQSSITSLGEYPDIAAANPVPKSASGMLKSANRIRTVVLEHEESSDDEDIEIELATNARDAGSEALANDDYKSAKPALLECLDLVQQLPHKRRASVCSVWDLRCKLAVCSFHLDDRKQAEVVLQEVLQLEPSSDDQRRDLAWMSHLLALKYLGAGKLDLARQSCQNALRGRRKLLGKQHSEYFHSLALMHTIYQRMDMPIRAEGYLNLIPESDRESHLHESRNAMQLVQENIPESPMACSPVRSTSKTAKASTAVPGPKPMVPTKPTKLQMPTRKVVSSVSLPTNSSPAIPIRAHASKQQDENMKTSAQSAQADDFDPAQRGSGSDQVGHDWDSIFDGLEDDIVRARKAEAKKEEDRTKANPFFKSTAEVKNDPNVSAPPTTSLKEQPQIDWYGYLRTPQGQQPIPRAQSINQEPVDEFWRKEQAKQQEAYAAEQARLKAQRDEARRLQEQLALQAQRDLEEQHRLQAEQQRLQLQQHQRSHYTQQPQVDWFGNPITSQLQQPQSQSQQLKPLLNLSPQEQSAYSHLFRLVTTNPLNVVSGERCAMFFEKTNVPANALGEIWHIVDTKNRGLLTKQEFYKVLRLIGWYQSGQHRPTIELAFKCAPLPKFDGITIPVAAQSATSPLPGAPLHGRPRV